jgi:hypothetical protein
MSFCSANENDQNPKKCEFTTITICGFRITVACDGVVVAGLS